MKLASSTIAIISLAVVGQVAPALAGPVEAAVCVLSSKILFLIFFLFDLYSSSAAHRRLAR